MTAAPTVSLDRCVASFLRGEDLLNPKCLELVVAKVLNIAIGLGSVIVKVPQIVAIVSSRSVEGLSPVAFYLDTLVSMANWVYHYVQHYAFETYSDSVFTTVQNVVLVLLLWTFEKKGASSFFNKVLIAALGLALTWAAFSIPKTINDEPFLRQHVPPDVKVLFANVPDLRVILQLLISPLLIISRGSQIWQNIANRSTGSLSLVTNALQFLGASARIFTTISGNGGDGAIIISNIIAASLSGIIVVQIIAFADASDKTKTSKKKKSN